MFFWNEPTGLAESIAASMRADPDAWRLTSYNVTHDTGLELRTASRVLLRILHPNGAEMPRLSGADRKLLWEAYQQMLRRKCLELLIPEPEEEGRLASKGQSNDPRGQ